MLIEIVVQIAREIASNGPRQIRRVRAPTEKSGLRFYDVVSQGAHVSRDNRQPETVGIQGCGGCGA